MNRTPPTPPVLVDIAAKADELDPWSEFLSESEEGSEPGHTAAPPSAAEEFLTELELTPVPVDSPPRRELRVESLAVPAAPLPEPPAPRDISLETDPPLPLPVVARPQPPPPAAPDLSMDRAAPDAGRTGSEPPPARIDAYIRPVRVVPEDDVPGAPVGPGATLVVDAVEEPPPPRPQLVPRADRRGKGDALQTDPAGGASTDVPLSIADVLARHTPVRPAEAVAVLQELCAVLTDPAHPSSLVPDARYVLLTDAGTIVIRPGAKGERDARSLSRLLHALLASATPPLPLRLFVTSAISSQRYRSLALFADALSHYGSPNRTELIRGLYRRTREMPVVPVSAIARPALPRPRVRARMPAVRRSHLAAAAGVLVILAAGTGAWRWYASVRGTSSEASDAAPSAGPGTGDAERMWSPDNWRLGSVLVPPEPPAEPPPDRPRAPRPAPPPVLAPLEARVPSAPIATAPPATLALAPQEPVVPPPLAARLPLNVGRTVQPQLDPRIYTSEHLDVQPPVLLPSQRLSAGTVSEEATNSLELLIDEQGVVQRVRLRNRPQRFSDVSILSQAKMLKFRPAVRNGTPVKYLLEMTSSSTLD